MSGKSARCPLCSSVKEAGTTTFAVDLGFGVVVVRGVPALVCNQCGDAWLEDAVASKLEMVVDNARSKQTMVEVAQWEQVAA